VAHVALVQSAKPQNGIEIPVATRSGGLYANSVETKLTGLEHKQIMEMWRVTHTPFRKLLERYETYKKGIRTYNRTKQASRAERRELSLKKWQPKDRKVPVDLNAEERVALEKKWSAETDMQKADTKTAQVIYINTKTTE
jgi:hypothetical protein